MNYGELQADVQAILNRDDLTTALTKSFIQKGLSRILRRLRAPFMEAYLEVETAVLDADYAFDVPGDFLEIIDMVVGTEETSLEYLDPRTFRRKDVTDTTAKPKWYTRIGTKFYIRPYPSESIHLRYYSDAETLSDDEDSNFLSDQAPDLVTYAALSYAGDYFLDDRGSLFEQRYTQIIEEIEEQARREAMMQTSMVVQSAYAADDYMGDY